MGWSAAWIALALLFNLGILYTHGKQDAQEFLAGYLIEKSLSVDNIFVFIMVFSYFKVIAAISTASSSGESSPPSSCAVS